MRAASALLALTIATCCISLTRAQPTSDDEPKIPPAPVPKLRTSGRHVQDFVPSDWKVCDQTTGDLNGDGRPDLVFLLQGTNKALLLPNTIAPDNPLDSNPYVLGVAFGNADGTYTLALQNSTLIPRWTESTLDEFSQTVKVKQGALSIWLYQFRSDGNTYQTFLFRYQHGRFALIGHERDELNRANQSGVRYSLNYLTQQESVTQYGEKADDKTHHKRLPSKPPLSIDQVGSAEEFYSFMQ